MSCSRSPVAVRMTDAESWTQSEMKVEQLRHLLDFHFSYFCCVFVSLDFSFCWFVCFLFSFVFFNFV